MSFLVAKANNHVDFFDEKYDPDFFVLELDKSVINLIKKYNAELHTIKNPDLVDIRFNFGFGVWTQADDWMTCTFGYGTNFYNGDFKPFIWNEDYPPVRSQDGVETFTILIDKHENVSFRCFGKHSGDEFYTGDFKISDLEENSHEEQRGYPKGAE